MVGRNEAERIADLISRPRLQPYLAASGGKLDAALRLYAWNQEASSAFAGALQFLEVVLRNTMDRRLATHFGRRNWWDEPRLTLGDYECRALAKAGRAGRRSTPPTADDIVAKLPFGFWVSLLSRRRNYYTQLWWPALQYAFPGYSGQTPGPLHDDIDHLCQLRNRVSHCEPIHGRHLSKDFETLLEVVTLISPEACRCLKGFSRVPEVLGRKASVLDGSLLPRI